MNHKFDYNLISGLSVIKCEFDKLEMADGRLKCCTALIVELLHRIRHLRIFGGLFFPSIHVCTILTCPTSDLVQLAQPIRLLLEYTGTKYEDKFYVCGEAPNYDKSCWLDEKPKLGLYFSNLPYLIDGDRKIVQSNAIMRYIARKHNLCGETDDEKVRVDIMENQAMDFRNGFVRLCYTDFDNMKPGYLKALPDVLKQFSEFMGDRKWFAGEKITFVDFIMYELLDQHLMFHSSCLDDFKNLKDFVGRFEALEKIAAYMKSNRFMKTPVNNKMAKWGHKK